MLKEIGFKKFSERKMGIFFTSVVKWDELISKL